MRAAAKRIRRACTRSSFHRLGNQRARRGNDLYVKAGDRNPVARLGRDRTSLLAQRLIRGKAGYPVRLHFHRERAVVDKAADRNSRGQLRGIADVIAVIVRDDDGIQHRNIRGLQHSHDAIGIASDGRGAGNRRHPLIARESRIDEHRFS